MKIEFHFKGAIIADKDRANFEKKLWSLKRFIPSDPAIVDVYLVDETGKGIKKGIDQSVHLSLVVGKEKFFIEETEDSFERAFAFAFHRLKRALERYHRKKTEKKLGRFDKIWQIFGR